MGEEIAMHLSFMARADKKYLDELVRLLKVHSDASGMKINWEKSCAC